MPRAKSSERTNEWGTPTELFNTLNREFDFTLDACASPGNSKVKQYFTKEDSALDQPWFGRVWINPPFENFGEWIDKILSEVNSGNVEVVVALLPKYMKSVFDFKCTVNASEVRWVKGRLHFHDTRDGVDNGPCEGAARFDVKIFVFRKVKTVPQINTLIDCQGFPTTDEPLRQSRTPKRRRNDLDGFIVDDEESESEEESEEEKIDQGMWEVEALLDRRQRGKVTEYLVLWKDFSEDETTWEPEDHIPAWIIREYNRSVKRFRRD